MRLDGLLETQIALLPGFVTRLFGWAFSLGDGVDGFYYALSTAKRNMYT